jgi:hypothetical protein
MSSTWFVSPETVWIEVEGERIEVKKRLTLGEERKAHAALISEVRTDGRITPNFEMMGKNEVLAYLVDWSLRTADGKACRIDTDARKLAAVDNLAPEKFRVISDAVTAHIERMTAEREAEKNEPGGESKSSATSPSAA